MYIYIFFYLFIFFIRTSNFGAEAERSRVFFFATEALKRS